jgi:hypothetical protein
MFDPVPIRSKQIVWLAALTALFLFPAAAAKAQQVDPYGDCCVARVVMTGVTTWAVTCGSCAANPGIYAISQPDPEKLRFVGPGGVSADSRYDAAQAICSCPSQDARRAWEKKMRTFDGN